MSSRCGDFLVQEISSDVQVSASDWLDKFSQRPTIDIRYKVATLSSQVLVVVTDKPMRVIAADTRKY